MKRFLRLVLLQLLAQLARPFARRPPVDVSRVLFIKPDHLGDLLLATPVLAVLRRILPNAQIAALVGPWSEMTLRRNRDVDVLLTCPFPGFERGMKDEGRTLRRSLPLSAAKGSGQGTKDEGRRLTRALSSFVFRLSSLLRPYLTLLRYALLLRAHCYDVAIVGRDDHWWARRWRCCPACRCGSTSLCRSAAHSSPPHCRLTHVPM